MLTQIFRHSATQISELWRYREILGGFVGLQLKLKYRRTLLGYVWSLLNPLLQLTVLSVVFSHIVKWGMKSYSIYLFSGLLAWNYFSNSLLFCSTVFLENESYLKKVYLPKLIFPLSRVTLALVDFLWALVAFSLVGFVLGYQPTLVWFALPFPIVLLTLTCLGAGLIISVANVYFRDIQYLITVMLQLLYFLTPILYPLDIIPGRLQKIISYNPLFSQLKLFQRIIYEGVLPTSSEWLIASAVSLIVFATGLLVLSATDDELVFRM